MINFDEEIKNYEPSLEIEEAESAIYSHDLTGHRYHCTVIT